MPTKKKNNKRTKRLSLAVRIRRPISRMHLIIFGLLFASLASFLIFRALAATTTVTYRVALTSTVPSAAYQVTTGTGDLMATLDKFDKNLSLIVANSSGHTIATGTQSGRRSTLASAKVTPGTYTISAKYTGNLNKPIRFNLAVTYPLEEPTAPTDTTPPATIIMSPNTDQVTGTVSLAVSAIDESGVSKVEFLIDNTPYSTDINSPYGVSWDSTTVSNGAHTLTVKAHDNKGNIGTASLVMNVSNEKTLIHPGVVYSKAEIDSWSTSNPEYTRLASSGSGSLSKVPWVYGTQINSGGDARCTNCDLNTGLRDQSGYAKVQAVLWAADNNNTRRDKVVALLNEYRTVTSFENDSVQQYRLVAGWGCTNLAQAAEIINYQDSEFKRFLKDVCYPVLDWTNGGNWHASFADSRLAIAAYLGNLALWTDAKAYFYERIKESIYHSAYDGNKVNALPEGSGMTQLHWGGNWGVSQINTDYTFKTAYPAVNGTNAERTRDLAHVNMGLGAWMHGMRTLKVQGEATTPEYIQAYNRLTEGYSYHSDRVLYYAQTGTFSAPAPVNGDGGGARFQAYYGARKLFGSATPSSVQQMLSRSEVTSFSAAGANHMVAEAFADGN